MNWEVRTMRSGTSCFNTALWKKNMARFWPIWGLYGLVWIFALPVNLLLTSGDGGTAAGSAAARFAHYMVYAITSGFTVPMSGFFGILAAMAVFSFLYSSRSVGLFHALPIRREGLFLTSYLSGLTFFLVPNVAVLLITLASEAAAGEVNATALLVWFLAQILCCVFFFSFAAFCAMFTGHLLALPAFYLVLNFLAAILSAILQGMFGLLYGFVYAHNLDTVARWLTPAWKLVDVLQVRETDPSAEIILYKAGSYALPGLGYAILYAVIGLVLAAVALAVYRRRQLETAGDIVAVSWVRPIFRYGFAACVALTFGSLLYNIFSYALPHGAWTLLIFLIICGVIGYFAAEMLLQKSFRVFHRWKGCVVLVACLVFFAAALELDFTGFETRIPDPSRVVSASVQQLESAPYDDGAYTGLTITDPEALEELTQIHRAFVERRDEPPVDEFTHPADEAADYASLRVDYRLDDGSILSRYYSSVLITQSDLADPNSLASRITHFLNRPENVRALYRLDTLESAETVLDASVERIQDGEMGWQTVSDRDDCLAIREAVLADFADGNLGRRYVMDYEPERLEHTYVNDLSITFLTPEDQNGVSSTDSVTVTLTPEATRTLAALEAAGIFLDGDALRTNAQQAAQNMAEGLG